MLIEVNVQGIDVVYNVVVTYVERANKNADNPADYYGYADFEYELHYRDNTMYSEEEWSEILDIVDSLSYDEALCLSSDIETAILKM